MNLSRRTLLTGAGAVALFAGRFEVSAQQSAAAAAEIPPILFVHGNGDDASLWITTLWRMESNGVPRQRMSAINFTDPSARADDNVPEANHSSTADQLRELTTAVADLKRRTGAARIALVGSSRGGYVIRNYVKNGGASSVSHAVLCGTPNHGVFVTDQALGSEFNGKGAFLRGLNDGDSEVTPGTAFLTLRSDGMDKYAQADGRFIGRPGVPTGVTAEGPELKGATNLVLGALDHRETAFHPRAFREIYKFIAGREPDRIAILPEPRVRLSGLVTGTPGGVATNRPVAGATVQVFRVDPNSGERIGNGVHTSQTGADGRWGPAEIEPGWYLEIVMSAPESITTHFYRSPFSRSSDVVNLRVAKPLTAADTGAGSLVLFTRPRGYFGLPRDVVLLDGRQPTDVKPGVPTDSTSALRLPASEAGRSVVAMFNEERIVARAWPLSENRIAVAELTT